MTLQRGESQICNCQALCKRAKTSVCRTLHCDSSSDFLRACAPFATGGHQSSRRIAPDYMATTEHDIWWLLDERNRRWYLLQPCAPCKKLANRNAAVSPESRLHRGHVHSTLVDAVLQKILSCAVYDRLCAFVRAHLLSHYG